MTQDLTAVRLTQLEALIDKQSSVLRTAGLELIRAARDMGGFLGEARRIVPHGEWGTWLDARRITYQTAGRYMRVYDRWPEVEAWARDQEAISLTQVYMLLEKPKKPKKPKEEPEKAEEKTEAVTQEARDAVVSGAIAQMTIGLEEEEPDVDNSTVEGEIVYDTVADLVTDTLDDLWENWTAEERATAVDWFRDKTGTPKGKPGMPTVDDVELYCAERGNNIDPQAFVDYYESQGWKKSNGRVVKDWRACVRTWERSEPTDAIAQYVNGRK